MENEKRLIDANRARYELNILYCDSYGEMRLGVDDALHIINMMPTVDAVEVVRCKDCKHYVLHALACRHKNFNGFINMNGFCSYGERKDNGEN